MKKADFNLNNVASWALLSPFAKMNSVTRLDMANNAFKHTIVPTDPEYPLVDSAYTNDILISTDNKFEKGGVKLLHKIKKIMNNFHSETCYIYECLDTGEVKLEIVPVYKDCYHFGYNMTSDMENMEVGQIKEGCVYTKYYSMYDMENNIVKIGKNINFIYDIDISAGEDAIIITESLANRCKTNHLDIIEFTISPDYIMRNIYQKVDEYGYVHYQPIALPGEYLKDGLVASMYVDDGKSFMGYSDDIRLDSDIEYMTQHHNARVVDIEIFSKNPIDIPVLENLRQEYRKYLSDINSAVYDVFQKYPKDKIHYSLANIRDKYTLVLNASDLRWDTDELKNSVAIRVTTVAEVPLQVGFKITNRHGGKGTISEIVPDNIVADDGTPIEMIINTTGIFNRENLAQLYERGLNILWRTIRRYLNESHDSDKKKKEVILKWLEYAKQPKSKELLSEIEPKELIEYYKNNDIALTYKPYDDPDDDRWMNLEILVELTRYTNTIGYVGPNKIYRDGKELSVPHYYGKAFYLIQANGPFKGTNIRNSDGVNAKGNPTKISKDRKKYHTKYGTTAVKQSDFALSIFLNSIYPEDKGLLRNNTAPLHDYLHAMGREFLFADTESGESDD